MPGLLDKAISKRDARSMASDGSCFHLKCPLGSWWPLPPTQHQRGPAAVALAASTAICDGTVISRMAHWIRLCYIHVPFQPERPHQKAPLGQTTESPKGRSISLIVHTAVANVPHNPNDCLVYSHIVRHAYIAKRRFALSANVSMIIWVPPRLSLSLSHPTMIMRLSGNQLLE